MVVRRWEPRRFAGWCLASPLAASALVFGGCGHENSADGAAGGAQAQGGAATTSSGGLPSIAVGGSRIFVASGGACAIPVSSPPVFLDQAFSFSAPFRRELYTWTTPEQIDEIRSQGRLLTRSEREGFGPGFAIDFIRSYASSQSGAQAELAALLGGDSFALARYAWSEPWATRMGFPGETYGGELLRMVLRDEALLAVYASGTLRVFDSSQTEVSLDSALAEPNRIAGFLFYKDWTAGGVSCGSFSGGGATYREFVIGKEAMIEEWSYRTDVIGARLQDNIRRLQTFFERVRSCPELLPAAQWQLSVGCNWPDATDPLYEMSAYQAALSLLSANYVPTPEVLASMIDTLQGDLFTPNPLVVRPGG